MNNHWSDDDEEGVDDGVNEYELQKLQVQYRRLCSDKHAYTKNSQSIIRKQNALIESLQAENGETQTDLDHTDSVQNRNKDAEVTDKLEELLGKNDEHLEEIIEERERINELDEQIRLCEAEVRKQHKLIGGVDQSQAYETAIQKQVRVLENRLDQSQVNFGTQLSHNRDLRNQIDHLRAERNCFDNIHKKLTKELDDTKFEMSQVFEEATQAYEQRDEFQNKMLQMQERNQRDQTSHESEMKELERIISHDNKLKEFMNIKAQDRAEYKTEEANKKKRTGGNGDKSLDYDKQIIADYETAFRRIKEITREDDLNTIVNDFIKNEDDNFALFNYVNELSANNEVLSEQCDAIRQDILKFKEESIKLEGARKIKMQELEEKLQAVDKLTCTEEEQLQEIHNTLDEVKGGVRELFDRIECDEKPVQDLLGSIDGIRDNNIMVYLGLIEQRTNELVAIQHYLHAKNFESEERTVSPSTNKDVAQKLGTTEQAQTAPNPATADEFNIVPPSTVDELDDNPSSDEDDKPFTREEIKAKLSRQGHKKEAANQPNQQRVVNTAGATSHGTKTTRDGKKKKQSV